MVHQWIRFPKTGFDQFSKLSPSMSTLFLNDLRRLIVKIGSTLLVDNANRINRDWLNDLEEDVAFLRAAGHQVLIVSSGAVAIGSHVLGINLRRSRLEELQAAAAAGQVQLVHAYQDALGATILMRRRFC